MATCNDIDASLAAVKASSDAKLAAMQAQLDACCAKADNSKNLADEAIALARQIGFIVAGLTSTVAGIVQVAGAFATAISTLNILAGRIDAVENGLNQLSNEVGRNYQDLFLRIRNIALTPGPIGLTGDKGATGEKGDTGSRGLTGDAGLMGLIGLTGAKGDTGTTGTTGDRGEKGNTGDTGLTGLTGITGDTGRAGDVGARGLDGFTGARGADGINGLNGTNGLNGVGIDGIDGTDGINGLDGLIGLTGLTGNDGVQGINGKDGLDGVDKGMDCTEMQACITPYFNDVNRRIDAVKGTQEIFVQEQAIQWVSLVPKILSIIGSIKTILDLVNEIKTFFSTKIDPLTYQETYDLVDSFFPYISGIARVKDCDGNLVQQGYQGKGFNLIHDMLVAQFGINNLAFLSSCNNSTQKYITANICGQIYTTGYQDDGNQAIATLLGLIATKLCIKLDAIDPTKENNKPVTGTLYLAACGISKQYNYTTRKELEPYALSSGILSLMADAFNKICQKLDTDPVANGNLTIDVCGTVITKPYSGVTSQLVRIIPTIQTQIMGQALTVICEKMEKIDCDPMILEPSEKYRERNVTTQMSIWFYPVGTTRSQRKNSPKWRINISNPKPNLTCADFAPLTWQRGKWLSKVFFNMDAIETYSYFADYDPTGQGGDAVDKMLHLASLSQIPLLNSEPRVTRANGVRPNLPNQPIIEVVRVIFVTLDANGQKTNVECLQCVS